MDRHAQVNVQTVLGPLPADRLGRTLFHEHLFIMFPGAEFDSTRPFDRESAIRDCIGRLTELRVRYGVATIVDPTPAEMGRDVEAMAVISEKSGVNVVCATGFYHETVGLPAYWRNASVDQLASLFVHELENGVGDSGIRPGIIKCATGEALVTDAEARCLEAAAIASKATGAPVLTHTTSATCGPEQQAIVAAAGLDLQRMVVGHSCQSIDNDYHRAILDAGSFIGFDRIGWSIYQSDAARADSLKRLIEQGYASRILISQDRYAVMRGRYGRVQTRDELDRIERLRRTGDWPPRHTYLFETFFPMMEQRGVPKSTLHAMLEDNIRSFFSGQRTSAGIHVP